MTKYHVTDADRAYARQLTDKIKKATENVYDLLAEAYSVKAWASLEYKNWREWATSEFDVSQSRAYQLLHQASVVRQLREAVSTDVENAQISITEAAARNIPAVLVGEVVQEVREQVAAGVPAQEAVRAAVASHRQPSVTRSSVPDAGFEDDFPVRTVSEVCVHEYVCRYCGELA